MQWKPKQVILTVYFMYTVNEMRLGELVKTVLHSEHPYPVPPRPPRKDFWSFLITPFRSLTEMSSSFNSPLYHHMTSENQVYKLPHVSKSWFRNRSGKSCPWKPEFVIPLVIGIQYLLSRNWSGHPRSTVMEIEIHSLEFNMSWIG